LTPRTVLGDVAEVVGAGEVGLVPESEWELAGEVGHPDAGGAARFAFWNNIRKASRVLPNLKIF
jgi:hypothetical protein